MSKITIIEGNSNSKDDVRAYMVKGERGYSAYEIAVRNGYEGTEAEWKEAFLNPDGYYTKDEVYNKEETYNKDEVYSRNESYNKTQVEDYANNLFNTNYADGNSVNINSLKTDGKWRIYIHPNSDDHNYLGWNGNAIVETFVQASDQGCMQRITQMGTGNTYVRYCTTNDFSYNDALKKINESNDSGWLTPTITHSSMSNNTIKYRKKGNLVEIRGTIKVNDNNYSAGSPVFSLPAGYRPAQTIQNIASAGGIATYLLLIASGGEVRFINYNDLSTHNPSNFPSNTTLVLNEIFFVD